MAPSQPSEESPRKTRRLNDSSKVATKTSSFESAHPTASNSAARILTFNSSNTAVDSSFNFSNHIPASSIDQIVLDITKFIPVGCLRITRADTSIKQADWNACGDWQAFPHQKDMDYHRGGSYLKRELQSDFFNSSVLKPYVGLHLAGWIRLEFKANDPIHGQIRVYVLPDDVGRGQVARKEPSLRKALKLLLGYLDIFSGTWEGNWDLGTPFFHIDPSQDNVSRKDPSLFAIFNTLPSPKPTPELVADPAIRDAMNSILESDIPGLLTPLHRYQSRSAALMLQREYYPGQIVDPRLTPEFDQKGANWFCDLESGLCFRDPQTFEGVRGGICAETMGLGKTLICLALILATRELSSQIPIECSVGSIPVRKSTGSLLDMAASRIGRTGVPWKNELGQIEAAEGYTFDRCREALERGAGHYFLDPPKPLRKSRHAVASPPRKLWLCTSTLVVVPGNLVKQWQSEIRKHTVGLKVLTLTASSDQLPNARAMTEYDLILFSKLRFDQEAKENPNDYHSPLKDLHFKRLIVDEGHSFGNSSSSSKSMAVTVIESLQLSARWIVSGTPTHGLGVLERPTNGASTQSSLDEENNDQGSRASEDSKMNEMFIKQERRDIEKLGNIATSFLQARPWANSPNQEDHASWSQLVMQPRHGSKSHGSMHTLRVTLEGMIVRHRPEDIVDDVKLLSLHQKFVYLDGSIQDKISLNTFSLMIICNAITSERKDADYFFHPRQRKALNQLVANMRQASFFWSGTDEQLIRAPIENARKFIEERQVAVTPQDEQLLLQTIKVGESILHNNIWQAIGKWHEMPMYLHNDLSDETRSTLSLIGAPSSPTLAGATMLLAIQQYVNAQLWKPDPSEGLLNAAEKAMNNALQALNPAPVLKTQSKRKSTKAVKKEPQPVSLAGGVTVDTTSPNRNRSALSTLTARTNAKLTALSKETHSVSKSDGAPPAPTALTNSPSDVPKPTFKSAMKKASGVLKSALKKSTKLDYAPTIDPNSSLAATQVVSTASAKLSYLMDKIVLYQETEKILIFYETDNIAYYIAQALEVLGIQHLIYAKTLSTARRSQYVVTFNQTETFRVLLMDVSQAAFGLNMSSASRVYFVNPVFSPQVEAQAVKRAHRIGQTKPVYVETLVLKGSIEEVIVRRRDMMTNEEHNKCKSILDDETVYNWIRNAKFQPLPANEIAGPDQMAKLESPQLLFGRVGGKSNDPDADLVIDSHYPMTISTPGARFADEESGPSPENMESCTTHNNIPTSHVTTTVRVHIDPNLLGFDPKELRRAKRKAEEPKYEPVDVPQQEAGPSSSVPRPENDDWEIPGWEDSDEELDI